MGKAIIKEVVLENFMSHEYSRIPFSPGLNIITGPNGAGKSSILLGISVALGLSHTERGRRLADLIRVGKDYAIVSLTLDNSPEGGKPFPYIRSDEVTITRVLKRDGQYLYHINYKSASKMEVENLLRSAGINPSNMLIIMHQNMIEVFAFLDPREKLRLFEDALGISEYRERILDARERLRRVSSEEEEIKGLLKSVEESLKKWEEQYRRLVEKRKLVERLSFLNRELAWSKYYKAYHDLLSLRDRVSRLEEDLHNERISLMRFRKRIRDIEVEFSRVLEDIKATIDDLFIGMRSGTEVIPGAVANYLEKMRDLFHTYGTVRGGEALSQYKIDVLEGEIKALEGEIGELEGRVRALKAEAEALGGEVETSRAMQDILADIRVVKARLNDYRDVDDSVEDTYRYYLEMHEDTRRRMEKILRDKEAASAELEKRIRKWREVVSSYVEKVSLEYKSILEGLGGSGYAKIINIDDVDNAGLDLYVGFGGIEPTILDVYSKSGGERTVASMCFLLALQKYITSPFRAVDEFDVHMDPRNRNIIMNYIIELMRGREEQYIIITPGYISDAYRDANIIVVQKYEGQSVPMALGEAVEEKE